MKSSHRAFASLVTAAAAVALASSAAEAADEPSITGTAAGTLGQYVAPEAVDARSDQRGLKLDAPFLQR
jgi:hypothetical protein